MKASTKRKQRSKSNLTHPDPVLARSMLSRLIIMDRLIREGEYPNCKELANYDSGKGDGHWIKCSERTIKRDIDHLRGLRAPIEYSREKNGFYYTDPSWKFPGYAVREQDLLALLIAKHSLASFRGNPFGKELDAIFKRLTGMFDGNTSLRIENLHEFITFDAYPCIDLQPEAWKEVVRGLFERHKVKIFYKQMNAEKPVCLVVHPYHLIILHGAWYLIAASDKDSVCRQYNMERIQKAERLDASFSIPPNFDVKNLCDDAFGRNGAKGPEVEVEIRVDMEKIMFAEARQPRDNEKIVKNKDGSRNITLRVRNTPLARQTIVQWILSYGRHAKVIKPDTIKNMVKEELRVMVELQR